VSLLCLFPLGLVAVGLGIAGVIHAKKIGGNGKGMAIAGVILGTVTVILTVGWLVLALTLGPTASNDSDVEDAARSLGREAAALAAFDNVPPSATYMESAINDLPSNITAEETPDGNYLVTKNGRHACLTLGTTVGSAGTVTRLGDTTTPC
jgi:hypothetical protein